MEIRAPTSAAATSRLPSSPHRQTIVDCCAFGPVRNCCTFISSSLDSHTMQTQLAKHNGGGRQSRYCIGVLEKQTRSRRLRTYFLGCSSSEDKVKAEQRR